MPWAKLIPDNEQDPILQHRFPYYVITKAASDYFVVYGRWPNVYEPKTYSEKIFWRKLFDRNPIFINMTDKLKARVIIENNGLSNFLKDITASFDEVSFVKNYEGWLHMSNASRRNARIGKDFGIPSEKILKDWKEHIYGYSDMEWSYYPNANCNFFIVEPWLEDVMDIKVFCFNGNPAFAYIARENPTRVIFIGLDGIPLSLRNRYPILKGYDKAINYLDEAISMSKILSKNLDHIRVDFLLTTNGLKFSEFTIYPSSGLNPFIGSDNEIGEMWTLSKKHAISYLYGKTPYA